MSVADLKSRPEAFLNRKFSATPCFSIKKDEIFGEESPAYCFVEILELFSLKKGYVFLGIE